MGKTFEDTYKESGRQSELDVLRKDPGKFDIAKADFERTTAGAVPSPDVSVIPTGRTVDDSGKLYGGWYDNPETGRNQRYWGNGKWTDGEEPGLPQNQDEVTPFLNKFQNQQLGNNVQDVKDSLTPGTDRPELIDREASFGELRAEFGVADLETQLNDLKGQEDDEVAAFRQQRFDERGKPVATNVISGRISKEEQTANERLDFIGRQKSRIVDELNTKYSVIGQIMDFKSLDYSDATSAYEAEFNENLQIHNLISKDKSDAQKSASANLQIYSNAIASGNIDYASLDDSQKTMINKLEAQSGMPIGFTASLKIDPGSDIVFQNTSNGVTQIGVRNAKGDIEVQKYGTPTKEDEGNVQATATEAFETVKGGDGYVDPKDYKDFKTEWVNQGGKVANFDAQFSRYINPDNPQNYGLSAGFLSKFTGE